MTYDGEELERALVSLFEDGLSDALATVAARKSVDTDIELAAPVHYWRGYRGWMLDLPSTDFPILLGMALQRQPDETKPDQGGFQAVTWAAMITVFVSGDTEEEAVTKAHRYAEAICEVLYDNPEIYGYSRREYEPAVRILADNEKHMTAGTTGSQLSDDDYDYIRMVEVTQTVEGIP